MCNSNVSPSRAIFKIPTSVHTRHTNSMNTMPSTRPVVEKTGASQLRGSRFPSADETTNKVMIAIDTSDNSEAAFDYYLKKLHKPGNDIVFTHSVEHPHLSEGFALSRLQSLSESVEQYKDFVKAKQEEVEKLQKKFAEKLKGLNIKHELKTVDYGSRNPGEALCKYADETRPAMIVMASRGHGLISRTILGSVSHYVLHHAGSPVLVCHHGKESNFRVKLEPERDIILS